MNFKSSIENVIENNYCIGCGACASVPNSPIRIEMNEYGMYQAVVVEKSDPQIMKVLSMVCPFANEFMDERSVAKELFEANCKYNERIGYYLKVFAGFVIENDFRKNGSSGGLTSWLLTELLEKGCVDGVVHVKPCDPEEGVLFKYSISTTIEDIKKGSKSRYYPIEMSQVLREVRNMPGKYAFVGVPCFIKAIRLLSKKDKAFSEKVGFAISLFCGHLKSKNYLDYLVRKMGVDPKKITYADFRKKIEGRPANDYALEVLEEDSGKKIRHTKSMKELVNDPWGSGLFKYKACDFCDDVAGETVDIALGDAWLPQYVKDTYGTNIVIIRNKTILEIFHKAEMENRIKIQELTPQDVIASQEGNFRHRQDELGYRLFLIKKGGIWVPKKRVAPSQEHITKKRRLIQEYRIKMAKTSHEAYLNAIKQENIEVFENEMNPLIKHYQRIYRGNLFVRVFRKVKRSLHRKGEKN